MPWAEYWSLFFSAFLAATVIPFSSEVVVATLLVQGHHPIPIVLIATVGNTLGSITSYALGYLGKWEWLEKYFRMKREKLDRAHEWTAKRGPWLALFCWLPIVGDPLAVGLGFSRSPVGRTCLFIAIGKLLRYAISAWLILSGVELWENRG
jgi:membrane protein YqaA with SNARE-associated domain